jgi:hypothetical protein
LALTHYRCHRVYVVSSRTARITLTLAHFPLPFFHFAESDLPPPLPTSPTSTRPSPTLDGTDLIGRVFDDPDLGLCQVIGVGPRLRLAPGEGNLDPTGPQLQAGWVPTLRYTSLGGATHTSSVTEVAEWVQTLAPSDPSPSPPVPNQSPSSPSPTTSSPRPRPRHISPPPLVPPPPSPHLQPPLYHPYPNSAVAPACALSPLPPPPSSHALYTTLPRRTLTSTGQGNLSPSPPLPAGRMARSGRLRTNRSSSSSWSPSSASSLSFAPPRPPPILRE